MLQSGTRQETGDAPFKDLNAAVATLDEGEQSFPHLPGPPPFVLFVFSSSSDSVAGLNIEIVRISSGILVRFPLLTIQLVSRFVESVAATRTRSSSVLCSNRLPPLLISSSSDGGEGHVGTVREIGRQGSSNSPDKTVVVNWDSGNRTNYRVGYQDKYDLIVVDNAQIGELLLEVFLKVNSLISVFLSRSQAPEHHL